MLHLGVCFYLRCRWVVLVSQNVLHKHKSSEGRMAIDKLTFRNSWQWTATEVDDDFMINNDFPDEVLSFIYIAILNMNSLLRYIIVRLPIFFFLIWLLRFILFWLSYVIGDWWLVNGQSWKESWNTELTLIITPRLMESEVHKISWDKPTQFFLLIPFPMWIVVSSDNSINIKFLN